MLSIKNDRMEAKKRTSCWFDIGRAGERDSASSLYTLNGSHSDQQAAILIKMHMAYNHTLELGTIANVVRLKPHGGMLAWCQTVVAWWL